MPRKTTGEPRRAQMNIRARAGLREKIEAAANESGRALAQEVEFRLEQSFEIDRLLQKMMERTKIATIRLLSDYCDGPENLSTGLRVAQRLSSFSLPEERDLAVKDIQDLLPKIFDMRPLALVAAQRVSDVVDEAMFDMAFVADLPEGAKARPHPRPERAPGEPIPMPEGYAWEKPENLKLYQPIDQEGDLFKSVIDDVKKGDKKDATNALDKKTRRQHNKKE